MKLIMLGLAASMVMACQGPEAAQDITTAGTATQQSSAAAEAQTPENVSDSSEGMVGPDEGFLAGIYLESVFSASQKNQNPKLVGSISLASERQPEAFDFAANLQPRRLGLMARILLKAGDTDGDGQISAEEFSKLAISESLIGKGEGSIGHKYGKELFEAAAGEDALLSSEELQDLLRKLGQESALAKISRSEMHKILKSAWEKVLVQFDSDKDGKLSLAEQRKVRMARAELMEKFGEE